MPSSSEAVASVYNRAGDSYIAYADGDAEDLFAFDGPHAQADRQLWVAVRSRLMKLRASGQRDLRVLDAGCGPGTWLRRVITHALELGFTEISARGFDVAENQVDFARAASRDLAREPGVHLILETGDLANRQAEDDASVDLTLCLYSVLSHLPLATLPGVVAELARVTRGYFVTTVRTIGSTPSIFVDSLENARRFRHDFQHDRCTIEMLDGRRFSLAFHLFGAAEFKDHFVGSFGIEEFCGIDLFHSRFAPDPRWNPASMPFDAEYEQRLADLEETCCRMLGFMERASHLMLIGTPRRDVGTNDALNMGDLYGARGTLRKRSETRARKR